jgi:pyruvate/2-oxoglutarate/acetoin dehydrogenase E1 component
MTHLANYNDTIFIGQSVKWKGTGLYWTIQQIPNEKKIELPVFEDIQMGISIGLSLEGYTPISIYPRMDFLICAYNQLVNHLDKMDEMSDGQFKPKVIMRTAIGSVKPLFPGPQHCQDHCDSLEKMLTNVDVVKLTKKEDVFPEYEKAYNKQKSTILVEIPDLYDS